jgi:hypothetical protein
MKLPEPLPNTHLARVDCNRCGRYVLAAPEAADIAKCTTCWIAHIDEMMAARKRGHK